MRSTFEITPQSNKKDKTFDTFNASILFNVMYETGVEITVAYSMDVSKVVVFPQMYWRLGAAFLKANWDNTPHVTEMRILEETFKFGLIKGFYENEPAEAGVVDVELVERP